MNKENLFILSINIFPCSTRFDILGVPLNGGEGVQITVNVVDVNDNAPVFSPDFLQVGNTL